MAPDADATEIGPRTRAVDTESRRARVAPLLAAGLTMRQIAAETGIPLGAVHRAKRQIEKARAGQQAVEPLEPPPSVLMQRVVNGVPGSASAYHHRV